MDSIKGYNTLRQMIDDYKLYHFAKKNDPRRMKKESVTNHLKLQIAERRSKATKRFKEMMVKKGYTELDLELIALNDNLIDTVDIYRFLHQMPIKGFAHVKLKKIMQTAAYKNKRLTFLEQFIPRKIDSKEELVDYIQTSPQLSYQLLSAILSCVAPNNWRSWVAEASRNGELRRHHRGWI